MKAKLFIPTVMVWVLKWERGDFFAETLTTFTTLKINPLFCGTFKIKYAEIFIY